MYNNILVNFILLICILSTCLACPCGKGNARASRAAKNRKNKIVGGSLAAPHSWPWTVALIHVGPGGNQVRHFCGGSIINNRYILTAAHCTYDIAEPLSNYRVYMGDNKINGTHVQKLRIQSIIVHQQFNSKTLDNDISLIRLELPITFSDLVRPICFDTNPDVATGRKAVVAGWGSVRSGGPTVNAQREVSVDIVSTTPCRISYATVGISITANMLCAASNKKDSCSGDSGGPLFLKRKSTNIYDQIGIVSFGKGCALRLFPGVYTKVSHYKNWIDTNSLDGQKC